MSTKRNPPSAATLRGRDEAVLGLTKTNIHQGGTIINGVVIEVPTVKLTTSTDPWREFLKHEGIDVDAPDDDDETDATGPDEDTATTPLKIARAYLSRGWNPIPLRYPIPNKYKGKEPIGKAWQKLVITTANIASYFDKAELNIGVQLGPKSNGLTDIDLDCEEAIRFAHCFLPKTPARFGRKSKPVSHLLFQIDDAPPDRGVMKLEAAGGGSIVELRMGGGDAGAQTVFPGSAHESGEAIEWVSDGTPARSDFATLKLAVVKIAVATVLHRAWPSGSGHNAALALGGFLARCGWTPQDIEKFVRVIVPDHKNADDSCRTAKDSAEAFARGDKVQGFPGLRDSFGEQPAKAIAKHLEYGDAAASNGQSADTQIEKLNDSYALVVVGDTTAVMKIVDHEISFMKVTAFEQWHANQHVYFNDKKIPLGKFWLTHPKRRQYPGITFSPKVDGPSGHYNLWRGFSVEPKEGDCSKFLAHIRDNVCCGNQEHYQWTIGWFAQLMQQPDRKIGTSLVFRGEQGTGKTKVGDVIGSLFHPHYQLVSSSDRITGRFNSHLKSCLLLHADEAFWAGDRSAEGKLKDLVTSDYQQIEFKGKDIIRIRNYIRLLVTGNNDWVVPAGFGERRFAVFDMGMDHKEDHPYFAAIDQEMNNGGREALLYHLLHFDLTTVNLRRIPKTKALLEQQISSMTAEQSWWLDTLMRGELPRGCDEFGSCPSNRLFDRYISRATKQGIRRRSIETQLGWFLQKHVPSLKRAKRTYRQWDGVHMVDHVGPVYTFPSLSECRKHFAGKIQQVVDWKEDGDNEVADWSVEPMPDLDGTNF